MIKKFNNFINEDYGNKPGEGVKGSTKVELANLEVDLFNTEPALQKLISDQKVSLYSNCVWFNSDDIDTVDVLMSYIPNIFKRKNEVTESLNESNEDKKKRMMKELTDLGDRIKDLQREYDKKVKDVNDLDDKIEKNSKEFPIRVKL